MSTFCHTTRQGIKIPLDKMSNSHLLNTVALIQRRAKEGLTLREGGGTGPEDFWCAETNISGDDVLEHLHYDKYVAEARCRGILDKGE